MSRRTRADDSSLELLLDTICNTFGGILFLAMLVALLLQSTRNSTASVRPSGEPPQPAVKKADVIRLSTEAHELAEEVRRLEDNLQHVRAFLKQHATPELQASVLRLHETQQRQRELEASRAELLADTVSENTATATALAAAQATRDTTTAATADAEEAKRRLAAAQSAQATLQQSGSLLQEQANKRNVIQSTGKAPRERPTTKREFGLLVRYGRAFLMHTYSDSSRTVNTKDFVVTPGAVGNTAVARPSGGFDVLGPSAEADLARLLAEFPSSRWYPCLVVHPDSFDAFQVLKASLVKQGYEYRVIATGKPVADAGGSGRVQ